ncbi:MAG: hypothetical protein ACKO0M_18105 [Cyanobium sp.]
MPLQPTLRLLALFPLLALGGCGLDQMLFGRSEPPPPPAPVPPSKPGAGAEVDVSVGLTSLPTPDQVRAAVPFGRTDPFAPYLVPSATAPGGAPGSAPQIQAAAAERVPGSGGPTEAPLAAPSGFTLNGVLRTGGSASALVTFGSVTGTLRLGDRGGRTTDLLPSGWALSSIQFGGRTPADLPSVTLQNGRRKVKVSL